MNEEVRFARIAFYNNTDILQLSHVDGIVVVGTAGHIDNLAFVVIITDRNGRLSSTGRTCRRIILPSMNSPAVCISRIIRKGFKIRRISRRNRSCTEGYTAVDAGLRSGTESQCIISVRNLCTPAHSRGTYTVRSRYIGGSADSYRFSGFRVCTVTDNRTVRSTFSGLSTLTDNCRIMSVLPCRAVFTDGYRLVGLFTYSRIGTDSQRITCIICIRRRIRSCTAVNSRCFRIVAACPYSTARSTGVRIGRRSILSLCRSSLADSHRAVSSGIGLATDSKCAGIGGVRPVTHCISTCSRCRSISTQGYRTGPRSRRIITDSR